MARRDHVAFKDKDVLEEMLSLRRLGWSYFKLGMKYDRDHTTILYWCQKMRVQPLNPKKLQETTQITNIFVEEKLNPGKSYIEYRQDALKRKMGKLYFLAPKKFRNPFDIERSLESRKRIN